LKDALVCLIKDTEVYESARTGPDGQVTLNPNPATPGSMDLTVTGHNGYPYQTTIEVISPSGPYLIYYGSEIDDDNLDESQGNDDGDVDIGETIELPVMLKNLGDSTALQVSATLSSADSRVTIIDDYEEYGDIPAGESAFCLDDFDFWVSPEIHDQEIITFNLDITAQNGTGSWNYPSLDIVVHAPVLLYQSSLIDDIVGNGDGTPDPDEVCNMEIVLENDGSHEATAVEAELISDDFYVTVINSSSSYPDIPPQGSSTSLSSYQFQVRSDCPEGHSANFILQINAASSYSISDTFQILIGQMPVLLVDDDDGENYQIYFETALDSLNIPYDVWTYTSLGAPSVSDLELYTAVIWTTADDYGFPGNPATLTQTDQANLMSYLDGGGKLFLSSQDLLYDNDPNTFITDYLHVADHVDDQGIESMAGVTGDTITDGMAFTLNSPFYNFADYITPGTGATPIFSRTGKTSPISREGGFARPNNSSSSGSGLVDYCALRYPATGSATYKVVFFSFPFEAIPQTGPDPNNARTVMERILNWFGVKEPSAPPVMHGDTNGDEVIDLEDVLFLINYLYKNGSPPIPLEAGDANCDGMVDLTDILFLVNYLYKGGPAPPC